MGIVSISRLLFFALFLSLFGHDSWARDMIPEGGAERENTSGSVATADVLIDKIKEADDALARLISELPTTEGEDLSLLHAQIIKLIRKHHADFTALTDLVSSKEEGGADVTLLKQHTRQLAQRSSRRVRGYIQSYQAAIERESSSRATRSPNELQVFEHDMAERSSQLDRLYLGLIQLTDNMAGMELSIDDELDFLKRQLTDRGDNLFRLLELNRKQRNQYRKLFKKAPDDTDHQAQIYAVEERYNSNKNSLLAAIHMMDMLGMEYTDLEVRTLDLTAEITPEALHVDVAKGLVQRWFVSMRTSLTESGPEIVLRLLVIVGILVLFWMLSRLVRGIVNKALSRTRISTSTLLREMAVSMAGRAVMVVGFIIVLFQLGINPGPILAGFGIAGFILGFALQDTLANFAAGAMILAYRPYDVGDFVEAAGIAGRVRDMSLVSTRILTVDHQTLIVPNSKIWGDVIRNVTAQPRRRVDMVFGISYEDEITRVEKVLEEIVGSHDKVLKDPAPVVRVHTLNDSSVDFVVRPWARTEDYWDVYWDITREVKLRFDREGISIPYPQRDVHVVSKDESVSNWRGPDSDQVG